jgi:transposase
MRDLCRAREAAVETLRRARQQVTSFLLRQGRIYSDGKHWTGKYRKWLASQRFDHPARQIAFEEHVQAMEEASSSLSAPATWISSRWASTWKNAPP